MAVSHFTVWGGEAEQIVAASSSPNDNFANAMLGISLAIGILGRESLVRVFVASKHQVGVSGVKVLP